MTPLWRRPIWILGHLVALTACVLFVRLGFWQLDRLDQKRDRNAIIAARADRDPVDVVEVVRTDEADYRHVTASGRYERDGEVTIRNRTLQGTVGRDVVTPLVLDDGSWLYVNRGWIGLAEEVPSAPRGDVRIEGLLRATEERGSIGPRDPASGTLTELNRVDLERLQQQAPSGVEVLPLWLQQTAPETETPILLDPPARDEGPHLSYAIQWFLFTGVVGVGYPILLRKRMRSDEEREPAVDGD